MNGVVARVQNFFQRFRRTNRDSDFFYNYFIGFRVFFDPACSLLDVLQIDSLTRPRSKGFGRSVDCHKNNVRFVDASIDIR